MEKKNKTYSVEFKIKAVELSKQRGSITEIANELGVFAKNLSRWRQEYDAGKFDLKAKTKIKTKDELEMIALRKELRDKEIECEILKKALHYYITIKTGNIHFKVTSTHKKSGTINIPLFLFCNISLTNLKALF